MIGSDTTNTDAWRAALDITIVPSNVPAVVVRSEPPAMSCDLENPPGDAWGPNAELQEPDDVDDVTDAWLTKRRYRTDGVRGFFDYTAYRQDRSRTGQ